jgi:hypothetical protein
VFKKVNNSSVGTYAVKKRHIDDRKLQVEQMDDQIEDMITVETNLAKLTLSKIVQQVERLILPELDVAHDMQRHYSDINLKLRGKSSENMWSTNVCINTTTEEYHIEKDNSYTLITVPLQNFNLQKIKGNIYDFRFKLNDQVCISLPMTPDVTFMFSVTFLTHRQNGNSSLDKNSNEFVNLSSYGNHKLFTHIHKSFARNIQDGLNII